VSALDLTESERRMREESDDALTDRVVKSFAGASSPRERAVLESLVRHLHGFIREATLTDDEWRAGIDFLTRTGHTTNECRQEFILLSDILGASMLTVRVNQTEDPAATDSTVFGPFYLSASPGIELGDALAQGAPGRPLFVRGTVCGPSGEPISGARLEVWGADEEGLYDVQHEGQRVANRGHLFADDSGNFTFWSIHPVAYSIPADGPVGELLRSAERSPMRPAHLHFVVSARGWRTLVTHLFVAGDRYLGSDAEFGVVDSLVVPFVEHPATEPPPGRHVDGPWSSVAYDFVLAPSADGLETAFGKLPTPL
jgi:hydroxyquinol 1,2-dioxygenase